MRIDSFLREIEFNLVIFPKDCNYGLWIYS
jgi:hypothetical protein